MQPHQAELSSIASAVGELTERITVLADGFAQDKVDDLAYDLYEVERALRNANRRLAKVVHRGQ